MSVPRSPRSVGRTIDGATPPSRAARRYQPNSSPTPTAAPRRRTTTASGGRTSDSATVADDAIRGQIEDAEAEVGRDAYNLAELGIGTNVGVTELVGSVLLDEKAAGTIHIAIGDDAGIGGDTDAPLHLDGIVRDPTVTADGDPVDLPRP